MIIIQVLGGLGNQMFQIALYKVFEKKGRRVCVDISKFDNMSIHNGYEIDTVFYSGTIKNSLKIRTLLTYKYPTLHKILKLTLKCLRKIRVEKHDFIFDPTILSHKGLVYL